MIGLTKGALPWLPPAPGELRRAAKAARSADELAALARADLGLDHLVALDRACARLAPLTPLAPLRLALIAQATTDYMAPAIRATGLRHGFALETYAPAYGQGLAEVMDPESGLRAFGAEMALVAETAQSLGIDRPFFDPAQAGAAVGRAAETLASLTEGLQAAGVRTVILQTIPLPAESWTGSHDRRAPGSPAAMAAAVNEAMAAIAERRAAALFDADAVAALVGRAAWFDAALWRRAKVPFSLDFLPLYAEKLLHVIRALRGRSAKCLVLDLDNTLWGGVIGDDGLEGIAIGQGSAAGESHLAVQHFALGLKARGIILAVCSKNEEANARLPFEKHPDMALRLDDFAVFVANWDDKATNLARIAKTLNIGADALVFLDDNPAERARVRQMLPEVGVPEVGEDPADYPAALAHGGWFETVGLSADDAKRAEQYRANAARTAEMETMGDYGAYLRSLDMICTLAPFDAVGRNRIAQLVNKSNQFNLTTRRYTEADIAAMEADPACFTLQIRLTDRFGDNGMISVVIFRREMTGAERAWLCDTWLMSCRVLKRRVEEAALAIAAAAAKAEGVRVLYGDWLPSPKNAMVKSHFEGLGFAPVGPVGEGGMRWALDLSAWTAPALPMKIETAPALAAAWESA